MTTIRDDMTNRVYPGHPELYETEWRPGCGAPVEAPAGFGDFEGSLVVRYADASVEVYSLDVPNGTASLRGQIVDAAHGLDVVPIADVWHILPAGDPVRLTAHHIAMPYDEDDYSTHIVAFAGVDREAVARFTFRVDGRS